MFYPPISFIEYISIPLISLIIDERFWLYLFFIVSGFLLARKPIDSVSDLIKNIIGRFLRLALPVFFSYFIIYIIYTCMGFCNNETTIIFQCKWFQEAYSAHTYNILDVLYSPVNVVLLGKCSFNTPYWVLRLMFLASFIIYIFNYLHSKFKSIVVIPFIFIASTLFSYYISPVITACLIGMLTYRIDNYYIKSKTNRYFYSFVCVMLLFIYILPTKIKYSIFFAIIILATPRICFLNNIFKHNVFQLLGNISWGIYSFHWPLICSAGAYFLLFFNKKLGLASSYLISYIILSISIICVAILFFYSFEKLARILSNKILRLI